MALEGWERHRWVGVPWKVQTPHLQGVRPYITCIGAPLWWARPPANLSTHGDMPLLVAWGCVRSSRRRIGVPTEGGMWEGRRRGQPL